MARSRMLRPQFFNDRELSRLSLGARLLYLALLPQFDRNGVMLGSPQSVKSYAFPYDEKMRYSDISRWLAELHKIGRIIRFTYRDFEYVMDPNFATHQRVYANDPDIYQIPVEIRLKAIRDFDEERKQLDLDLLNLNQNLNLNHEEDKKNQAFEKGDSAEHKLAAAISAEDAEIRRENQKLMARRVELGLNANGTERIPGWDEPGAAKFSRTVDALQQSVMSSDAESLELVRELADRTRLSRPTEEIG